MIHSPTGGRLGGFQFSFVVFKVLLKVVGVRGVTISAVQRRGSVVRVHTAVPFQGLLARGLSPTLEQSSCAVQRVPTEPRSLHESALLARPARSHKATLSSRVQARVWKLVVSASVSRGARSVIAGTSTAGLWDPWRPP